jgi:hypothetical protein
MEKLLLILDFFVPLFFFFLGRCLKGEGGRALVRVSLMIFFLSLVIAPLAYLLFSLSAQGIATALILFLQFSFSYPPLTSKQKQKILP